jgi:hypothetical protein
MLVKAVDDNITIKDLSSVIGDASRHRFFLVYLGPRANAGMVPVIFFSKLPLHASHVALH